MRSKQTPAQTLKAKADQANNISKLAVAALGYGVTRPEKNKADAALTEMLGPRKAAAAKESALQRAGAEPKGWRRFVGGL